jgi:H+-transporting ATPase
MSIQATNGLSSQEAQQRLQQFGANAVPEERPHPLLVFLRKLWGPVPWMLEITIILQFILGRYPDVMITLSLLLVNGVLSFVQENRAQNALALLRQRLTIQARVLRDGDWRLLPAQELVPGDIIRVRAGDVVPADLRMDDGQISVDQSALTGESALAEIAAGSTVYAGSTIKRGEGTAEVIATGSRTYYGKTADLVHTARTVSHVETIIQTIVKYLVLVNGVLAGVISIYGLVNNLPLTELLPFVLILLVASVPVALPTTFTLANALGSMALSRRGILTTRLSALTEAAGMEVLCTDKTGTLTRNELKLVSVHAFVPYTEDDVLEFAALASDASTQDPIDLAVLDGAASRGKVVDQSSRLLFIPFDSKTKRTEVRLQRADHISRAVKGFPAAVASIAKSSADLPSVVEQMAAQGDRVLAVATGTDDELNLIGLIGLQDPPREDSQTVIEKLRELGIGIVMVTGDSPETARIVAGKLGIDGAVCSAEPLRSSSDLDNLDCAVFAGVYPDDKFRLVQGLQKRGRIVGMTGDGVNDAPALKQAEVGIAVANATDVAKASASLVLTNPGLTDMLVAVEAGRQIFQRMLTYTLNKIIKTFQIGMFLTLGLLITGVMITRPRLILLLLFANDFVTMSIATDRVSFSRKPDHWRIRPLVISALVLASGWLVYLFAGLLLVQYVLRLPLEELQTFVFVMLVFTGQANVYLVRERGHFWRSRPSLWLACSTIVDVIVVSLLAAQGILMVAIPPVLIAAVFGTTIVYMVVLDLLKVWVFARLGMLSVALDNRS